jgi:Tol biopolymer transport system component
MKPDGSHVTNLSALQPSLPPGHHGSVYWHPSGKYLLFTAQKREWKGLRMFGNPAFGALPGFGRHDDLWLISSDGSHSWQLTNERDSNFQGVLMPVFSPDGKHIAWASSLPAEKRKMNYALKIADFVEYPQPHLENIKSYQPGGPTYYETGSFTADGKSLYYTSDQDTHNFWLSQIYRLDLETGISTRLTRGITYNEHPTAISTPTGDWVIFMSSKGAQRYPGQLFLGTDWYACRRDGTGLKRLTWMNLNRKDNPENTGKPLVGCTVSISPDGTYFLGDVQDDLVKQTGKVLVVRLVHYLSD